MTDCKAPASLPLHRVIRLLATYEEALPGAPEQMERFLALRDACPGLDFPTRLEPRTVLRRHLINRQLEEGKAFSGEIDEVVRHGVLAPDTIPTLVSLLAEGHFELAPATLFDAADQIARLSPDLITDQAFADLVALAERRTTTDLDALLHRLSRQRTARPSALFAAMQAVASHNPASLANTFRTNRAWIDDLAVDAEALAHIMSDVAARAGPAVLLDALAAMESEKYGKLLLAAFGFECSPFAMVVSIEDNPDNQRVTLQYAGEPIVVSSIGTVQGQEKWLARVSAATLRQSYKLHGAPRGGMALLTRIVGDFGRPAAAPPEAGATPTGRASILPSIMEALWEREEQDQHIREEMMA